MRTVLLIEDDPAIRVGLQESLAAEHFQVTVAGDGEVGYQIARKERFDLILLDLMLPGKSGEEICRGLRSEGISTPIIMLTAKGEEIDKIIGLEIGADDYVTKPFSVRELQARIRALLRRSGSDVRMLDDITFDDIHIDFKKQSALKSGEEIKLSTMEFKILRYFVEREGEVITRDMLLDDVWGYDSFPTTRTVDNYILALRKKLEPDPPHPRYIVTVHRAGYRFVLGE